MSATSSLLLKFLIISSTNLLPVITGSALSHSNLPQQHSNSNNNNNHGVLSDWQLSQSTQRIVVGRMDQLELRISRLQSLIQMRFDNIESSYTRAALRLDVWGDELNRLEEQLSRKWKIMESKMDTWLATLDSKLDIKLTAMHRDNRRYQEFLSNAFTSTSREVKEKVNEVNSSLEVLKGTAKNYTIKEESSTATLVQNSDKMLNILQEFVSNASSSSQSYGCAQQRSSSLPFTTTNTNSVVPSSMSMGPSDVDIQNQTTNQNQVQLFGNKVTNMFEDLMRRYSNMETTLKDVVSIANVTRKDVHDGFRTVLATSPSSHNNPRSYSNGQHRSISSGYHNIGGGGNSGNSEGGSSGATSSELMSAVIVQALASVDSMSLALGRKITEFSRSMDERLEIVSMSINGFLESCGRIQDNQPLIEEHIADLLIKILNTVDNSTRLSSELWLSVANQILDERDNFTKTYTGCKESPHYTTNETVSSFTPENSSAIGSNSNQNTTFSPTGNTWKQQLSQTGSEPLNNIMITTSRPSLPRYSNQSPITQPRYEDDDAFEDVEDTETDYGEEETTTHLPEESLGNSNNGYTDSRHNLLRHQRRQRPASPSPSTRRPDGDLTDEEKSFLWESLTLSPSPST